MEVPAEGAVINSYIHRSRIKVVVFCLWILVRLVSVYQVLAHLNSNVGISVLTESKSLTELSCRVLFLYFRAQMSEDYGTQFSSVFQQWESDIQRTKDQDKKLMVIRINTFTCGCFQDLSVFCVSCFLLYVH